MKTLEKIELEGSCVIVRCFVCNKIMRTMYKVKKKGREVFVCVVCVGG